MSEYRTLDFTDGFLDDFASRDLSKSDRAAIKKALHLLDDNEQHPSLRVHQLHGRLKGTWSASVTGTLRVTFERVAAGRKRVLACNRHYGD